MAKKKTAAKKPAKKAAEKKPVKKSPDEIRRAITQMMVDAIEQKTIPWRTPWSKSPNSGHPCNFQSKRRYGGINAMLLMWSSMAHDWPSKNWGSGNAWSKATGGHITKGQKSTRITLFNMIPKRDPDTKEVERDAKGNEVLIPIMREFSVFNVDQIQAPDLTRMRKWSTDALRTKAKEVKMKYDDGWTNAEAAELIHVEIQGRLDKYRVVLVTQNDDPDFEPAEQLLEKCGAEYRTGQRASYSPSGDVVTCPPKRTFESVSAYYETKFHELIHWTGHPSRLNRKEKLSKKKDREDYAFEELVAEIGACYLCMALNVPHAEEMLEKSKSYVKSWVSKLKNDPKYIFDAAKHASEAADMLLGFVGLANDDISQPYEETKKPAKKRTAKKKVAKKATKKKTPAKKKTKRKKAHERKAA